MLWLDLDRRNPTSLTQQVYDQLVSRILTGKLPAGTRLPSSRQFAADLKIARNIVVEVFEQLQSEGYVEPRHGSGTFVVELEFLPPKTAARLTQPGVAAGPEDAPDVIAFSCGVPDLDRFPRSRWLSCMRQVGFHGPNNTWGYDDVAGQPGIRAEIAAYLQRVKGMSCTAEQVIMTAGGAHGVLLLGLYFQTIRPGALVEDPVVNFVPQTLQRCGHELTPVPVDAHGLVVEALPARPRAGHIFVSPSHQFPLGGTLPIQRRLALLDYARRHDLFLVEDDYDSEFRFSGAPVSSLFRLDPRRVIHVGTFSKSLAPALRLGYLVMPTDLLPGMLAMLRPLHLTASKFTQEAVARFMRSGHFQRHVTRMKRVYERKMQALDRALRERFGANVTISGHTTGLHLVATFPGVVFDAAVGKKLAAGRDGVRFDTVDDYAFAGARHPGALALGFGNLGLEQIAEGVRRLSAGVRVSRKRLRRR